MRLTLLIIGMLLLAGCAGDSKSPADASASPRPSAADVGAGSGRIAGSVVDDESRPVVGARVGVVKVPVSANGSDGAEVVTGGDGRFTVSGLAAGTYMIQVSSAGFEALPARQVIVQPDETTELTFVLVPLPSGEPYVALQNKKSRYNGICYPYVVALVNICIGTIVGDNQNLLNPNDPNRYDGALTYKNKEAASLLETILVEARWTNNPAVCKIGTKFDIFSPDKTPTTWSVNVPTSSASDPFFWTNLPNVSTPIAFEIPRRGESDNAMWGPTRTDLNDGERIKVAGDWKFRWWAYNAPTRNDPSCAIDVLVELWFSFHYGDPMPAGYSAFP